MLTVHNPYDLAPYASATLLAEFQSNAPTIPQTAPPAPLPARTTPPTIAPLAHQNDNNAPLALPPTAPPAATLRCFPVDVELRYTIQNRDRN